MFTSFFYLLRARGVPVSLDEWMTLMEALKQGLHGMTLIGFYSTCRAVLVKSEARYDDFDRAFLEFFGDIAGIPVSYRRSCWSGSSARSWRLWTIWSSSSG